MANFEIRKANNGDYYWRLKSKNGEIICWSEPYAAKQGAEKSIKWTKVNAASARVDDET